MNAPSQPSDKLKAILRQHAKGRASAPQAADAPGDDRVETLLDRGAALPDALALARLYRDERLLDRLPDEQEQPGQLSVQSPSMSPAEVRAAIKFLQEQQGATPTYKVIERPPDQAIRAPEPEPAVERGEGMRTLVGGVLVLLVIGFFLYLAWYGPLRAPATSPTPSPGASAAVR